MVSVPRPTTGTIASAPSILVKSLRFIFISRRREVYLPRGPEYPGRRMLDLPLLVVLG
jgi:hypothetical protein